jgi:hypothetical protein
MPEERYFSMPSAEVGGDVRLSPVIDPIARSRDPLTGGNARSMANHSHDVTMTTRPGAQNAEAVFGIMVGYSLDEARQHFLD